ncbi:MAG: hypothetical protein IPG17_29855 [Sandaracinaceae bacterium]|nr:hypothetical protein [Sandaracinaceae bacterium]
MPIDPLVISVGERLLNGLPNLRRRRADVVLVVLTGTLATNTTPATAAVVMAFAALSSWLASLLIPLMLFSFVRNSFTSISVADRRIFR